MAKWSQLHHSTALAPRALHGAALPLRGPTALLRRSRPVTLRLLAAAQQSGSTQTAHRRPTPTAAPGSGQASSSCRTHLQAVAQTAAALPPQPSPGALPTAAATNLLARAQALVKGFITSPHDTIIFSLAAPAILALAADPLLAMVDTAIVGHLGQNELGALGVNNSLFGFAFIVFNFLSTATTPMVAAALSAGDKTKSGETIIQALGLASVLGVLVTLGLTAQADSALQLMGLPMDGTADPVMANMAREFLLVRATAAPAALLVTVSQGVFRGLQDMRTPLAVTLGTNIVHLILSLLFIFPGHMGVTGAAASTSIAEWLAAGAYLALGWGRRQELGLDPLPTMDVKKAWKQYLPFLQAGGAVLMRTAVLLGTKTLASAVATRLGPASIASHQVLTQVWSMSSLLIDSLGISGQTLVAVSIGQGDRATARKVTDRLLQLGVALGVGLSGLLALLGPAWPSLFTEDPEVLGLVSQLMPLAIWMLPLNALVYVLDGVLVGAADFQFLVGAMVLASGAAASLLLSVEPLELGLAGVWGAQVVLMAGRAATLGARYWSSEGPLPPSVLEEGAGAMSFAAPAAAAVRAGEGGVEVEAAGSGGAAVSASGSSASGSSSSSSSSGSSSSSSSSGSSSGSSGGSSSGSSSSSSNGSSGGSSMLSGGSMDGSGRYAAVAVAACCASSSSSSSMQQSSSPGQGAPLTALHSQPSFPTQYQSDMDCSSSSSSGVLGEGLLDGSFIPACGPAGMGCGPVPSDAPELAGSLLLGRPTSVQAQLGATGRGGRGTA